MDKVTNVFGKNDAYVDMKANFYAQFQKELASGVTALPDAHSWCEALSLIHVDEHVKADLQGCLEHAETFKTESSTAFKNITKELSDLRDYSAEIFKAYKQSVNDHCMVSISNDHLMHMASNAEDQNVIDNHLNSADQVEIERLTQI